MGKLFLKDEVHILTICAVMLMRSAAQQEYFLQTTDRTWNEARSHCQVCYKDLVTLTPANIHKITLKLSSDHWVGLRKNFTSNSNMSWSQWANGDPLTFQNWYPGWPVFKSSIPERHCCSCSCTCPAEMSPSTRSTAFTTQKVTDISSFSDALQNVTSTITSGEPTTQNVTSTITSGEPTTQNVTSFITSGEPTTQNMTSTITSGEPTTQNVTSFITSGEPTTQNVTSTITSGEPTTQNVTSFITSGEPTIQNVTSFITSGEPTTQNVTSFTTSGEPTTQNVTSFITSGEPTTQNVTSSREWRDTSTQSTLMFTTAGGDVLAECVRSPMLPPKVPESDENYIEDSCVAMLRFGAWVEKNCSELLPSICYDDRFSGKVIVTQLTSVSANIKWLPGPNNTSHYRVVVNEKVEENVTDLTYDLVNLTAGTRYSVQVFPVKCLRDLSPQEISFYTTPNKVENLTVTDVTENLISLSWNKPDGNVDFYRIDVQGVSVSKVKAESKEINDLIPGRLYAISVRSGVGDSTWSEESNITRYTKPGKVSNLMVSNNAKDSLLLTWTPPTGSTTGYWVEAMNSSNHILFNKTVTHTVVTVTDLPVGTEIILSVTALANDTLKGDTVTVVSYTAPEPVSNLVLVTTHNSLTAHWDSVGNQNFTVHLKLHNKLVGNSNVTDTMKRFDKLKTASKYTVIVFSVSGNRSSQGEEESAFTLPLSPTKVKVTDWSSNHITLKWEAPDNIDNATYLANISSSFWDESWSVPVSDQSSYKFSHLTSGTNYTLSVQTKAGELLSDPVIVSHLTDAEKVEIGLSMLCSSVQSLLCDRNDTRESVFLQLHAHFNHLLQDSVFWELEKQETGN